LFNKDTNEIVVSNVGDAACFIKRDGVAITMTDAHKPSSETEKKRIENAGMRVVNDRINSVIAVSRSFGDKEFKGVPEKKQEEQPISCVPHISKTTLTEKDSYIVLCCGSFFLFFYFFYFFIFFLDGITDVLSPQGIINYIDEQLNDGFTKEEVAEVLCEHAIEIGSRDNCSAIILFRNN
jgi:serine/threonine protein phosphatase PrpC